MKIIWRCSLIACLILSLTFFQWQNNYAEYGGNISLIKALWLGMTVFFWLIWPVIVLIDKRTSHHLKQVYALFFSVMLLRTVVEFYLLSTNSWDYQYGRYLDIFSFLLLAMSWIYTCEEKPLPTQQSIAVLAFMFAAETGFSPYIATFNSTLSHTESWSIDWQSPHFIYQIMTLLLLIALFGWLYYLNQHWFISTKESK